MSENDVEVRSSPIQGQGVFATRKILKGETVLAWDISHSITDEEFAKLPAEEKRYIARLGDRLVVMQPPAKFVNHSCNPNTSTLGAGQDIALRDIEAGEEITAGYLENAIEGETIRCNCGSGNCTKEIRTY